MKPLKLLAIITAAVVSLALAVLLFAGLVNIEARYREASREPIPISLDGGPAMKVAAYVKPDFLGAGEAWWIEIDSEVPLKVGIDGEWEGAVPTGRHRIESNHDVNNTGEYGERVWHEVPTAISLERLSP